jgi:murein DD-endopeptidase MepM/ murein hydrolase activator NlpD
VIEPERISLLQLASFLAVALSWQMPAPSLGAEKTMDSPLVGSSVVREYRQSETPYSAGHRGIDYEATLGQAVFAPADGKVHFVGEVVNRHLISLDHGQELLSAFEPVCSQLNEGDSVVSGQLIGEVCEGDASYDPHCQQSICVHSSVRKIGEYLSPLWFTGELTPSRLLPWIEPTKPSDEL